MEQVTEREQYQVFINHRGTDTKKNLASLIYHNLSPFGLRVFLDQEELRTGDTLCPAIQGAISSASVHIAIFSENYARSSWCLNELVWMLRSPHERKIIPIFCDVEPSHLRNIKTGPYAEAFRNHRLNGRNSKEVVKGWKAALREAADISGLLFKTKESDYGKVLREIENIVIQHIKWDSIEVATHPVGLDQTLQDLDDQIQKQSDARVVVIAGISGIGKSTLAKYIFNLRRSKFSRASYLFNVREHVDLTSLQRKLLRDLLGKDEDIPNTLTGKSILRNSLKGLKVLIVFDGVKRRDKIFDVLDMDALGPGSLIFITTHDKGIVRSSRHAVFYDVKPLKRNHARELFCCHAFHQSNPLEGYEDLVERFLKICEGLPLCLTFLGEKLAEKLDRTYWKRQLETLSLELPVIEAEPVMKAMRWSYADMEIEQQRMFLDVGSFFVGEDLELAVRVLDGLGYHNDVRHCLEILRQKSFVDFQKNVECIHEIGKQGKDIAISEGRHLMLPVILPQFTSKIIMHNQVRELARRIVREDLDKMDKPLRLNCSIDMEKMSQLQSGSISCRIRGICIREDRSPPQLPNNITMRGLNILVVERPIDSSWFLGSGISGDLVWLRWRNSGFISLPSSISLRTLRVLEVGGCKDNRLEDFFGSIDEMPSQLRVLDIDAGEEGASSSSWSSAKPDDLQDSTKSLIHGNISTTSLSGMPSFNRFLQSIGSLMKNLIKIVLKDVTVLQSLPIDFSELKSLRHLDLSGSTNLTTLPNSFSQLLQLQHLSLRDCINLSIPMDILGEISTLEHIDFKGCSQLEHLPHGIGSQRRLRFLNLLRTRLLEWPLNLEALAELEQLRIGSASLTELPGPVADLVHLKELILVECLNLKHISTPIEQLTCLERLEIYGSKVPILPPGIARLGYMEVLTISGCPIENFALDYNAMDYFSLRDLTLTNTSITDISVPECTCPRLEILDLSCNFQLRQVEVFQSTLVKLNLQDCSSLVYLKLSKLVHLKFLNLNGCGNVPTLNVENWTSLEEIMAERCCTLMLRNKLGQLERLRFLSFSGVFSTSLVMSESYRDEEKCKMVMSQSYINKEESEMMFQKFMRAYATRGVVLDYTKEAIGHRPAWQWHKILICFLTTDEDQFKVSNNFRVRFVYHGFLTNEYTLAERGERVWYESRARAGERAWIVHFRELYWLLSLLSFLLTGIQN